MFGILKLGAKLVIGIVTLPIIAVKTTITTLSACRAKKPGIDDASVSDLSYAEYEENSQRFFRDHYNLSQNVAILMGGYTAAVGLIFPLFTLIGYLRMGGADFSFTIASLLFVEVGHVITIVVEHCRPMNPPYYENYIDQLVFWYKKRKDPNARNYFGDTELHMALRRGDEKTILKLIARGANLSLLDQYNNTPLQLCGSNEQLKRLIENNLPLAGTMEARSGTSDSVFSNKNNKNIQEFEMKTRNKGLNIHHSSLDAVAESRPLINVYAIDMASSAAGHPSASRNFLASSGMGSSSIQKIHFQYQHSQQDTQVTQDQQDRHLSRDEDNSIDTKIQIHL